MNSSRVMVEVNKENLESLYNDVTRIEAELVGIKSKIDVFLKSSGGKKQVTVYKIRNIAILEEVYRRNGIVTADELSEISKKWGREPKGSAGYFSGNNPSLKSIASKRRALTETGENTVLNWRAEFGDDWLDRVDNNYVGNFSTEVSSEVLL